PSCNVIVRIYQVLKFWSRRVAERRRSSGTRRLLHARPDAPRGIGRRRPQHQECLKGRQGGDGAYRPRYAGRRGRGEIRGGHGASARKSFDRPLAAGVAAVEGISLDGRLVGTWAGRSGMESAGNRAAGRTLGNSLQKA